MIAPSLICGGGGGAEIDIQRLKLRMGLQRCCRFVYFSPNLVQLR